MGYKLLSLVMFWAMFLLGIVSVIILVLPFTEKDPLYFVLWAVFLPFIIAIEYIGIYGAIELWRES